MTRIARPYGLIVPDGAGSYGVAEIVSGWPVFTDEVAFASDPFDDPQIYTDVTQYVKERSVRRGRQSENDRASTGQGTFILGDTERRFDPENSAGAYYPNVIPMRRLRCSASLEGVDYDVFTTFVDTERGWEREDTTPGYSEITAPGNDGFDILSTAFLTAADSFPSQRSGERITAVLDAIDWPADERDIDTGHEDVQAIAAGDANTDALTLILAAADTEPGFFFIDNRGFAVFHDRQHRLVEPYTEPQAVFADGPNMDDGRIAYARLAVRQSRIANDVRITPEGLAEQTASDATSIRKYRRRTQPFSTLHTSTVNAAEAASWRMQQTKDSYTRYEELELQPGTDSAVWEQIFARQLGDRITVIRTPPGGGEVEQKDCHIEAVSLDVGPGANAKCVWRLSPADQTTYWLAGVAGFGEAGVATRGAY